MATAPPAVRLAAARAADPVIFRRNYAADSFGFRAAVGCAANDDGRGCAALNVIAAGGKAAAVLPRATEILHTALG